MDQIWRSLPNDIVYKIVSHLDIDTRRAFRIPPRRILDFPNFELKLEITSGDSFLGAIFNFTLESMSKY